jgi:hypothetical protein
MDEAFLPIILEGQKGERTLDDERIAEHETIELVEHDVSGV